MRVEDEHSRSGLVDTRVETELNMGIIGDNDRDFITSPSMYRIWTTEIWDKWDSSVSCFLLPLYNCRMPHEDTDMPLNTRLIALCLALLFSFSTVQAQRTNKPVLHGKHWVAITGKPLAATAGGMTFTRGGNAVRVCAHIVSTRL